MFGSGTCQSGMSASRGRAEERPKHAVKLCACEQDQRNRLRQELDQAARFGSIRSSLLLIKETKAASMETPKHTTYEMRS